MFVVYHTSLNKFYLILFYLILIPFNLDATKLMYSMFYSQRDYVIVLDKGNRLFSLCQIFVK